MKLIAERLGNDAAWNTHTTLNAVLQWGKFNRGIWLDLECLTAAWAQRYEQVWVITVPVFMEDAASNFIGDAGELEVASAGGSVREHRKVLRPPLPAREGHPSTWGGSVLFRHYWITFKSAITIGAHSLR